MKKFFQCIVGAFSIFLYFINAFAIALMILFSAIFVYVVPSKKWRKHGTKFLLNFQTFWMDINNLIIALSSHGKWDIQGTGDLKPSGCYLMISNHRSWLDILALGAAFNRKLPTLKFFMKKELLWSLPLAGLACYVLGYPFLARHSKEAISKNPSLKYKDIETTRKACAKFKETPSTVINFVEGSRFSRKKHAHQMSPFQYLLKPKSGGIAIVLNELSDELTGIVNVTLHYSRPDMTLWHFVCGRFKDISIRYEVLPMKTDLVGDYQNNEQYRAHLQNWLNTLWEQKDQLLKKFNESSHVNH